MLNFCSVKMRYEPYPLAVLRPALDEAVYRELADTFPALDSFGQLSNYDYKWSLSEKLNAKEYWRFVRTHAPWQRFLDWIKSDDFIRQTVAFLKQHDIDLGVDKAFDSVSQKSLRVARSLIKGEFPNRPLKLRSRFEFSALKADGGEVAPHTDTPKKIITLVLSMVKEGEWAPETGGGLDINRSTDPAYAYNWENAIVPWEKTEIVDTVPFLPNQCVVFVKTFNSLHSVRKMTNRGSNALRKSVTIVIEKDE